MSQWSKLSTHCLHEERMSFRCQSVIGHGIGNNVPGLSTSDSGRSWTEQLALGRSKTYHRLSFVFSCGDTSSRCFFFLVFCVLLEQTLRASRHIHLDPQEKTAHFSACVPSCHGHRHVLFMAAICAIAWDHHSSHQYHRACDHVLLLLPLQHQPSSSLEESGHQSPECAVPLQLYRFYCHFLAAFQGRRDGGGWSSTYAWLFNAFFNITLLLFFLHFHSKQYGAKNKSRGSSSHSNKQAWLHSPSCPTFLLCMDGLVTDAMKQQLLVILWPKKETFF